MPGPRNNRKSSGRRWSLSLTPCSCVDARICPFEAHAGRVDLDVDTEPGEGNFMAFLRFRVDSDGGNLASWTRSAPGNALHTIWETQNAIISICGRLVVSSIAERSTRPAYSL